MLDREALENIRHNELVNAAPGLRYNRFASIFAHIDAQAARIVVLEAILARAVEKADRIAALEAAGQALADLFEWYIEPTKQTDEAIDVLDRMRKALTGAR